jgi:hypothetical protein
MNEMDLKKRRGGRRIEEECGRRRNRMNIGRNRRRIEDKDLII